MSTSTPIIIAIVCFVLVSIYRIIDFYIWHNEIEIEKKHNNTNTLRNISLSLIIPTIIVVAFFVVDTIALHMPGRNFLTFIFIIAANLAGYYFIYIQFTKHSTITSIIYFSIINMYLFALIVMGVVLLGGR